MMWVFYLPDDMAIHETGVKMRLSEFDAFQDQQATARIAGPVN